MSCLNRAEGLWMNRANIKQVNIFQLNKLSLKWSKLKYFHFRWQYTNHTKYILFRIWLDSVEFQELHCVCRHRTVTPLTAWLPCITDEHEKVVFCSFEKAIADTNKSNGIHLIFPYSEEKRDSYIYLAKYCMFLLEREIHFSLNVIYIRCFL